MARRRPVGTDAQRRRKRNTLALGARRARKGGGIVAEGDSWFDYVVKPDVIDYLIKVHGLPIKSVADPGHLLMDMVYGTSVKKNGDRSLNQQISKTRKCIREYKPKVFLFSGGGNDIAGPELMSYLFHAGEGRKERVNWPRLKKQIRETYATAYRNLHTIVNEDQPGIHFVTHGYADPFPDGRSVDVVLGIWQIAGPWLRPSFHGMGHSTDEQAIREDMAQIMKLFNDMLKGLSCDLDRFHYVDLRSEVTATPDNYKSWWHNELHLSSKGFKAVSAKLAQTIKPLLDS